MVKPCERKQLAQQSVANKGLTIKLACQIFSISETCYRYHAKLSTENQLIADKLIELVEDEYDWGFGLCFDYFRNVKGYKWNHKRVYRIYCDLALNLRIKPRRRLNRHKPEPLKEPTKKNQVWSIDFMSDSLSNGRHYRVLNIIDDYRREALQIDPSFSFQGERVIRTFEQIFEYRDKPLIIRCDNGPEFISKRFVDWANEQKIEVQYIQPGKPTQNSYIERFNKTVRYGWLGKELFDTLEEVQDRATAWMWSYNHKRPHQANEGKPPLMAA